MGRTPPLSYEEIVRRTVPEPDGSFKPSPEQVAEAGVESRPKRMHAQMTDDERALHGRIAQALVGAEHFGEIGFELEGRRVILLGSVAHLGAIEQIEQRVAALGVEGVDNRLVVRASPE